MTFLLWDFCSVIKLKVEKSIAHQYLVVFFVVVVSFACYHNICLFVFILSLLSHETQYWHVKFFRNWMHAWAATRFLCYISIVRRFLATTNNHRKIFYATDTLFHMFEQNSIFPSLILCLTFIVFWKLQLVDDGMADWNLPVAWIFTTHLRSPLPLMR